jgi:hypothetical protein
MAFIIQWFYSAIYPEKPQRADVSKSLEARDGFQEL